MATAAGSGTWRVLVVDDEQNLNWSLVNSLRKEGYTSDGALTGAEAQRLLRDGRYDCVISDVKMPGMDGFELLQWLREHQPQMRVIMMTAFGSPTARDEALRGGVVAYLEKPFDLHALKEELRRLFATETPGQGESYDLLEVARVINLSRRDIALAIQCNGQTGMLRFVRGELFWAETAEGLRGDEAFLALCATRAARMQPLAWDGRTDSNVVLPLSRLLYMALARRDGRAAPGTRPLFAPFTAGPAANGIAPGAPDSTREGTVIATGPTASAPALVSTPQPVGMGPLALPVSGPLTLPVSGPLILPPDDTLVSALASLGGDLPAPHVVALMKTDGSVLAHTVREAATLPAGAYIHLAATAQAAARALLVADLGIVDDVRVTTSEHLLLVRRLARAERTVLLALVLPASAEYHAILAAIRAHTTTLLDALH